jgi:GH24 family phage-related lysozyme (muramidase)
MTVCRGDTNVPMHVYTHEECGLVLAGEARTKWLPAVQKLMPHIDQDPYMWAAYGDFAYNAGIGSSRRHTGLAGSRIPALYNSGHKVEACHEMERYKFGDHKFLPGLYHRRVGDQWRIGEVELCLMPFPKN